MADNTTTTFSSYMKEIYGEGIKNGIRADNPLYDLLKNAPKRYIGGKGFFFPVRVERAGNVGAVGEGDDLPTPTATTVVRSNITTKELWGRFEVTKRLLASTKGSLAAFKDSFAERAELLQLELKENFNRQLVGNKVNGSATGVLAEVSAVSTTTITLTTDTAHQFRVGMPINYGTAGGTRDNGSTVASIAAKNQIVTSDDLSAVGDPVAAGDFLWIGDASFSSYNQEMNGLAFAVDNATSFQGIDPSSKVAWKAHKNTNSGTNRPLQKSHVDGMFINIKVKSGKYADCIVCHDLGMLEIKKLMESDVRYEPQTFKGGFEHSLLVWNNGKKNCPIIPESNVELTSFYFLNKDQDIGMGTVLDWGWLDDDGGSAHRVTNKATFEYTYGCMKEVLWYGRNSHGLLGDITVDDSSVAAPD